MFIAAVISPNADARRSRRQCHAAGPGRTHSTRTTAAPAIRNHATPAGSIASNSPTATAAPRYIDVAPTIIKPGGSRRSAAFLPAGAESARLTGLTVGQASRRCRPVGIITLGHHRAGHQPGIRVPGTGTWIPKLAYASSGPNLCADIRLRAHSRRRASPAHHGRTRRHRRAPESMPRPTHRGRGHR